MPERRYIMQCPFNLKIVQQNQDTWEYDENNNMKSHNHILVENQTPTECKGKNCACWKFGRCRRRS